MLTYCYAVWAEFLNFIGGRDGLIHWILYIVALIFCAFMGKSVRKKLFWPSILVLLFFFNPLFYAYVGTRFLSGIYWRLLWMLPVSFVIAYAATQMAYKIRHNFLRFGVVALVCICVIASGDRIFSGETYSRRENNYKIPQAAIEVSDAMIAMVENWKETAIVPNELLCYIRQYTSAIGLLYGRNAEGFISNIGEDEARVFEEMGKEEPDVRLITDIAKAKNCRYIVFNASFHKIPEDLTGYGYARFPMENDEYVLYYKITA